MRDAAEMRRRPGWDRIRAVRENHVCALDAAEENVVTRPGPRLAQAAQVLARCLSR
jgi:iron complex transport system substrate-binding protein